MSNDLNMYVIKDEIVQDGLVNLNVMKAALNAISLYRRDRIHSHYIIEYTVVLNLTDTTVMIDMGPALEPVLVQIIDRGTIPTEFKIWAIEELIQISIANSETKRWYAHVGLMFALSYAFLIIGSQTSLWEVF